MFYVEIFDIRMIEFSEMIQAELTGDLIIIVALDSLSQTDIRKSENLKGSDSHSEDLVSRSLFAEWIT